MEYAPLGDLEGHLRSPLPEVEVREITRQVLKGLDFMHSSRFAHRDLKPNVCPQLIVRLQCRQLTASLTRNI